MNDDGEITTRRARRCWALSAWNAADRASVVEWSEPGVTEARAARAIGSTLCSMVSSPILDFFLAGLGRGAQRKGEKVAHLIWPASSESGDSGREGRDDDPRRRADGGRISARSWRHV